MSDEKMYTPPPIVGYRPLSQSEVDTMNEIKEQGKVLDALCEKLANGDVDRRWLAIGRTDLQTGLMALTRSVAKPGFF